MSWKGNVTKMKVELSDPVKYSLPIGDDLVNMNDLIGKEINLAFNGQINCISCGRLTSKSFAGGFCFPCFKDAPENSECIIRPELCEAHLGKGRDPEWEKKNHLQPHVVYIAVSAGVKVGVTRNEQIPTRWIDQGAWKAVRLCETENRFQAGAIEVHLKNFMADKTPWQGMLKNDLRTEVNILEKKKEAKELLGEEWVSFYSNNDEIVEIGYPVEQFPEKVKSINFDKVPNVTGTLQGIKGQYLLFDEGRVLNIRKHSGYYLQLRV